MKVYASYSDTGKIKSIVIADITEGNGLLMSTKKGEFFSEIEGIKFRSESPDLEELREIAEKYKVCFPKCTIEKIE